jgi:dipeptide transport system substrate-binding protein
MDKGTPEKFDFEPVGTGPFIFKNYEKDQVVRFTRNENYFLGSAQIKNLLVVIVPDPSVRVQKVRVAECDIIMMPPMEELDNLKANANIEVEEGPSSNTAYLVFNTSRKPFDDPKVRRALSMSLNIDSYVTAVYGEHGEPAISMLPTQMLKMSKGKAVEYNPEKAKKLLADAGHKDGLTLTLWSLPVSRHYNPNGKRMAELMQSDLKKIGVDARIQTFDWPTYLSKLKSTNEHELAQLGWGGDTLDPDSFFAPTFSCTAASGGFGATKWCNAKFDTALRNGRLAVNAKQAEVNYRKASEIFQDELPAMPIAHAKLVRVNLKRVKNYQLNPSGGVDFYNIRLE